MTTILLADDHILIRQGLRFLIEAMTSYRVIGEASDGLEAVRLLETLHPDILIVDILMPGLNGLQVARQAHILSPQTRLIVLSMYDAEAYVAEALQSGVSAFVLKKSTSNDLLEALRHVQENRLYLSPPLDERVIQSFIENIHETPLDPYDTLTSREREILHLAAEGLKSVDIAARFSISPRTVEMHRAHYMRKLHLKSQSDLIRYAVQRGILKLDSNRKENN